MDKINVIIDNSASNQIKSDLSDIDNQTAEKLICDISKDAKKILLLCPGTRTVMVFRIGLIKALQSKGYSVSIIAFDNEYEDEIIKLGVDFYYTQSENRSMNPLGMLKLKKEYRSIIRQINPDIVFTFMIKPNIFGVKAAKKTGVARIYSMVEGAGDVFINNTLKWKLLRFFICKLYRNSLKHAIKVFFLNSDDKSEFVARRLVKENQSIIIPGIGVDVDRFAYKPLKNNNTFLMIARMLKTKGVLEYCQAARIVKNDYPHAVFNYLGGEGNIKISDIQEYINDGSVNYLGTTEDVRPYIEDCSVFVLPTTYREGMPMSIMEAESVGRAIIATDAPGCKDQVSNNGFLISKNDINALTDRMIWFLNNPDEMAKMGKTSRKIAEEKFDNKIINAKILEIISE